MMCVQVRDQLAGHIVVELCDVDNSKHVQLLGGSKASSITAIRVRVRVRLGQGILYHCN